MLESKVCDDVGSKNDPFFAVLKAARKGDVLSQFLLARNLEVAIQRKLIKPLKYPQEYMRLRDEAIDYLKQLSAKGVTQASVNLAHYYNNSELLPSDLLMEYYYSYLAVGQGTIGEVQLEPNSVYEYLTDKQKEIADRLTENL